MLSMRWNQFPVCSACHEISSPYAQCAIKFVPRMLSMDCTCKNVHILPLAEHARKFVPRMLSMRWNRFRVCSACDEIGSVYAQHAIKSFPRMLSIRMLKFSKMTQKSLIKMQISPIKIPNFDKPSRNPSNRTKVKILEKKNCRISLKKNLVPRLLSHRGNVWTSKFCRKSKKKKRNFFQKFTKDLI